MFQQFQQLQDDVAELRGIVEEQSHQIEKLQADQKEQYLDLDRRVAALSGGCRACVGAAGGSANVGVQRRPGGRPGRRPVPQRAPAIPNATRTRRRST